MKLYKRILSVGLSAALIAAAFTACADTSQNSSSTETENSDTTNTSSTDAADNTADTTEMMKQMQDLFSADSIAAPDLTAAVSITLSDDGITADGSGVKAENGVVTVTQGGVYVISGTLSDGRIIVDASGEDVTLVLQNADITCTYGSPLYVFQSASTTVYLADGSQNSLCDGENYTFADSYSSAEEEEPNACLYSKSDLVIAGSGSLTVTASYNNGITGKDTLQIDSASLTVNACGEETIVTMTDLIYGSGMGAMGGKGGQTGGTRPDSGDSFGGKGDRLHGRMPSGETPFDDMPSDQMPPDAKSSATPPSDGEI